MKSKIYQYLIILYKMKKLTLSIIALAIGITFSCKKDEETSNKGQVNLTFNHKVGSDDLEFDSLKYTTAVGHVYEVRNLEYFISNITFNRSNGSEFVIKGPIYIDAQKSITLNHSNEIPTGIYESIAVTFGLDSNMNITDTLTSVDESNMSWPENNGGGYHYMKFEGTYDSLGNSEVNKSYNLHTGAIMGQPHDFSVTFDNSAFTLNESGIDLEVSMDLNEWFTNPAEYDFADYGPMIMMNMAAQNDLKANGSSVLSILVK